MSYLLYEARIVSGLQALPPLLALPVFALLSWWIWEQGSSNAGLYELVRAFELILPLSAGLAAAHLMSIEGDEGFEELRCSYPEPAWRLPLLRAVGASCFSLLALLAGVMAFRWVYGPFPLIEVLLPALPPTLYLISISLLAGNLTRNYWAAAAVVISYWFIEFQIGRQLGHPLFLFAGTFPHEQLVYDLNRWLLCTLGVFFLTVNFWLSVLTKRGVRLRRTPRVHG
ncbi:MAG: hypothetical protein IBX69_09255 [Anaerolineales bacterium]|nr:hypothetical protein [Anaerolineales bacterium]